MKRTILPILLTLLVAVLYSSCSHYETYGDRKKKEQSAIKRFIAEQGIEVISEAEFEAQGQTTDLTSNQYVHFTRNGVYMQIIRKGCGAKLEEGRVVNVLCRFIERDILNDTTLVRNDVTSYVYSSSLGQYVDASLYVDKMSVQRTGTTITASFVEGMMVQYHSSTSVPSGWLVPLNYVNIGRPEKDGDEIAKVRLIVPHSQGTADASSTVYPCYYEITYVREN